MKRGLIITIDGPAGAGKSTVARLLAKRLGYGYLDTGALYRVITYQAIKRRIKPTDRPALSKLLSLTPTPTGQAGCGCYLKSLRVKFKDGKNIQRVFLNGKDVTKLIRKPYITDNVFRYAELPLVRWVMLKIQRSLGKNGNIVAEGRDIGSVVFPKADIKFYLDASLSERSKRRGKELRTKGARLQYADVLREIKARDRRDMTRAIAPLKRVKDAIRVDTTNLSIKQVIRRLLRIIKVKQSLLSQGLQ